MTAPSPRQPCTSTPPAPDCVAGFVYAESCAECTRCGFSPCACVREFPPPPPLPTRLHEADAEDLKLADEVALGRLPFLFAPEQVLIPRDQLHEWLPGVRDAADSESIAEALLFEELGPVGPEPGDLSDPEAQACLDDFLRLVADVTLDDQLRCWGSITGRRVGFSPELAAAVSDIGDDFAPEPAGHGWNAGGDIRRRGSNRRERVDALLRRCEREPERRGRPVFRARGARRAAGGLARRAKPQGEGT